jgi:hypothetical protein
MHIDLSQETLELLQGDLTFGDAGQMHVLLKHSVSQESELVAITQRARSAPNIPTHHTSEVRLPLNVRVGHTVRGSNIMQIANHRERVSQLKSFTPRIKLRVSEHTHVAVSGAIDSS